MPKVINQGKTIQFLGATGLVVRHPLKLPRIYLYNEGAKVVNYRLIGSCNTCAVKVESEVSAANCPDKTRRTLLAPFSYNKPAFSL